MFSIDAHGVVKARHNNFAPDGEPKFSTLKFDDVRGNVVTIYLSATNAAEVLAGVAKSSQEILDFLGLPE